MKGVSALAGYTVSGDGEPLAFTIIMLNFIDSEQRVRDLQDRMAVYLSTSCLGRPGEVASPCPGMNGGDAAPGSGKVDATREESGRWMP
jgi:hypothetical protein